VLNEKQKGRCPSSLLVVDEVADEEEILGMLSMDDILRRTSHLLAGSVFGGM